MDSSPSPSLNDCLRLLKGERDEQKLAGLLLATKFCQGDDNESVLKVYRAVGPRFLDRLLMTGMGKGVGGGVSGKGEEERHAYLKLSVTVLAGFCRVPEIASSEEMVAKVPIVAEIISQSLDQSIQSISEECYEFLLLIAAASENGKASFYRPGVMDMLSQHIYNLQDGSRSLELAMQLLQLVFNELPVDMIATENASGLAHMVAAIARQFAVLHSAFKFDALHLLSILLPVENTLLHNALRSMPNETFRRHVRIGITAVLQNRVVSREKLRALLLVESMMSIYGEAWLLEQSEMHQMPVDKYMLLVLETARVEVAVLLNELAYSKYEASKSSATDESIIVKQRHLAITFSLIEKIIKLISHASVVEGTSISESTITKAIGGLNETINLVLDFLQDSKDHGQHRGDDLLAAVRIIGSYLAEAPFACKEKTQHLLGYMLSVAGQDESSPFYSICFLLPMLCQITTETEGCKLVVYFSAHKTVVECFIKMIGKDGNAVENYGIMFLASETILNILQKRKELQMHLEEFQLLDLLQALALWTENSKDPTTVMMASCICALVFDLTSEESLLKHPKFNSRTLEILSQIIAISFTQGERRYEVGDHLDLHEIITAGYARWADRFPRVGSAVEHALKA